VNKETSWPTAVGYACPELLDKPQDATGVRHCKCFREVTRSINPVPSTQETRPVRPKYLAGQEISGHMRAILVDWLVQVQMKFSLQQETLYMTVAIIDRYLQVSVSCLVLANAFPLS